MALLPSNTPAHSLLTVQFEVKPRTMPAPQTTLHETKALCHVNLMVDCVLANLETDDLRAIVRATLATCPPNAASAFTAAARKRLAHVNNKAVNLPSNLFVLSQDGLALPGQDLESTLRRARSLYGAGLGFASLDILADVVKATIGLQWEIDGSMADSLSAVDADISQAIQSAKEELAAGRVTDMSTARAVVHDLSVHTTESLKDTRRWGGDFPFEQAIASIEYWKL